MKNKNKTIKETHFTFSSLKKDKNKNKNKKIQKTEKNNKKTSGKTTHKTEKKLLKLSEKIRNPFLHFTIQRRENNDKKK